MVKNLPVNAGDAGLVYGLDHLKQEMTTTSVFILAWKIPWTKEPGGLQSKDSLGLQRVKHN